MVVGENPLNRNAGPIRERYDLVMQLTVAEVHKRTAQSYDLCEHYRGTETKP